MKVLIQVLFFINISMDVIVKHNAIIKFVRYDGGNSEAEEQIHENRADLSPKRESDIAAPITVTRRTDDE